MLNGSTLPMRGKRHVSSSVKTYEIIESYKKNASNIGANVLLRFQAFQRGTLLCHLRGDNQAAFERANRR